jgi:hypothetical protein
MSKIPERAQLRLASVVAGAGAKLDNLAFDMRKAAQAMQDFSDELKLQATDEGDQAKEVAEAALAHLRQQSR